MKSLNFRKNIKIFIALLIIYQISFISSEKIDSKNPNLVMPTIIPIESVIIIINIYKKLKIFFKGK